MSWFEYLVLFVLLFGVAFYCLYNTISSNDLYNKNNWIHIISLIIFAIVAFLLVYCLKNGF